ncbi:MAG: hypothetical protein WCG91_02165 [Candidatus Shapirobacteria bacterium]
MPKKQIKKTIKKIVKKSTKSSILSKIKNLTEKIKNSKKEAKYVKIPLLAAIFFALFLSAGSFFLGSMLIKTSSTKTTTATAKDTFAVDKTNKPEFDFFVMSFCPYGNQMEDTLRPVFDLLGSKANITPRYIFEKISGDLATYCKTRYTIPYDPNKCADYVAQSQGQLKDVADCKQQIATMVTQAVAGEKTCNDEKSYLKIGNNLYTSLHGRIEANQDVREICAFNLNDDKKAWWNFVDNVNKACTSTNADTCWEEQAKKAGLDTNKITECFNKDAASLIDKEIALTDKYKIQGSPSLMINGKNFPPESTDPAAVPGNLKVGSKVFTQEQLRSSGAIKEVICAAFKNAPKECKKELAVPAAATTGTAGAAAPAAAAGSCN